MAGITEIKTFVNSMPAPRHDAPHQRWLCEGVPLLAPRLYLGARRTFHLDAGSLDFPTIDRANFALQQAIIWVWAGFMFINFDADGEPLEDRVENLPEHFADFRLENRWKAAHVAKIMRSNWELAMEAFW